jgi:hypothetical protein
MRLGIATIRFTALVVLTASFSDYWAYDRFDPTAPMNASGPEALAVFDLHAPSSTGLHSSNLPDDQCICCSPLIAPPAHTIPQPVLGTPSVDELAHAVVSAELEPSAISASPPLRDPAGFARPLRV